MAKPGCNYYTISKENTSDDVYMVGMNCENALGGVWHFNKLYL